MGEGVQFAHMEFGSEIKCVNSSALQIVRQGVKFAANIGEVAFADFGYDDAAALNADLKAIEIGGRASEGIVRSVQAVLNSRVIRVVQAVRAKQQMKLTKRLNQVVDIG